MLRQLDSSSGSGVSNCLTLCDEEMDALLTGELGWRCGLGCWLLIDGMLSSVKVRREREKTERGWRRGEERERRALARGRTIGVY